MAPDSWTLMVWEHIATIGDQMHLLEHHDETLIFTDREPIEDSPFVSGVFVDHAYDGGTEAAVSVHVEDVDSEGIAHNRETFTINREQQPDPQKAAKALIDLMINQFNESMLSDTWYNEGATSNGN
tara:strand:- start:218 stop:595 length:378 start_codon:yes stop_codon:yes gene_type:complete